MHVKKKCVGGYFSNFIFSGGIRSQAELYKPGTSVQAWTLLFVTIYSDVRSVLTDPGLVFSTFKSSFNVLSCSSENPCNFLLIASSSLFLYFDQGISALEWLILSCDEHNMLIGSPRRNLTVARRRKQGDHFYHSYRLWQEHLMLVSIVRAQWQVQSFNLASLDEF